MRKLKSLQCICMIFCIIYGTSYNSNAQIICGTSYPFNDSLDSLQLKGASSNCSRHSPIFQDFLQYKENFRPYHGQNIQRTTQKEIRVRAIVVNNTNFSTPQYQNNATDRQAIQTFLEGWSNTGNSTTSGGLEKILPPTKPNPSNCTTCHIEDSKLKIKLVETIFINHNSTVYTSIINSLGAYKNDSILNVFLVEHEGNGDPATSGVNGWAFGGSEFALSSYYFQGSHSIFLAGPKLNAWGAFSSFLHELGHIFGLWHLYDYEVDQSECHVVGQSSNDWLTDIFPSNLCVINDPWACDPLLDIDPLNSTSCTGNIMGKGSRYLSPMQLGRMHRMAYLGSAARYVYPTEAPHVTPWEITSTQEWDFGIRMYQNIIVKTGNTLTIKCEVQMPPGGKIIVEQGAKLVLDGGTITSYHPKASWAGIELFGDKYASPALLTKAGLR